MRRSTAMLCAGALLAACSNGVEVQPIEPDPDAPATDTTSDEPAPADDAGDEGDVDPFAVPDDIDEAYAQAVLDELFALRSEALLLAIGATGERNLPDDAIDIVDATHDLRARGLFGSDLNRILDASNVEDVYRTGSDFGRERFTVERLVRGEDSCIVALGFYDRSGTLQNFDLDVEPVGVVSLGPASTPQNPTPWQLIDLASVLQGDEPAPVDDVLSEPDQTWVDFVENSCEGS